MRYVLLFSLLTLGIYANENNIHKDEAIKAINALGKVLKNDLQKYMQQDSSGLAAVGFCTAEAQKITNNVNKKLPANISVRRTSSKVRNTENKKDSLDKWVMLSQYGDGKANHKTTFIVEGEDFTRAYKPLFADKVCLKCHGQNIADPLKKAIDAAYPEDKAVGYKEGDLRGFIVSEVEHP
ncbi:MAG: DUF3365 domain-containing protein [Campylobacterales bacterium]|nr:DUF3365 domain-containing protein [Campylobacterales bacterium]